MRTTPADVRLLSVVTDALIDGGLVSKDIIIIIKNQQQHKHEYAAVLRLPIDI